MSTAILFFLSLALMLVSAGFMHSLSRKFVTQHVTERSFSIIDLQFPVDPREMCALIRGIYRLPPETSKMSERALKAHLLVDFLFMPGAYGSIFLLCKVAADHVPMGWAPFFQTLAWMQAIAWGCDILENIFLFKNIRQLRSNKQISGYYAYQFFVYTKWFFALAGTVCALSAFTYLLLSGFFTALWYLYLGIAVVVFAVYFKLT